MAKTLKQLQPHKFSAGDTVKVVRSGTTEWCKIGDTHTIRICKHDHEDGPVYVVDDDKDDAWIRECNLELVERDRQKGGEWKRHRGGRQPVASDVFVEVKLRDGDAQTARAHAFLWPHNSCDTYANIMQYRVISQPQAEEVEVNIPNAKTVEAMDASDRGEGRKFNSAQDLYAALDIASKAKTDQIDGPILWRDTVNELDAYIEEFTRERDALIERLASEGFALIPPVVGVVSEFSGVDMSFPIKEWQVGDIVEVVSTSDDSGAPLGVFKITYIDSYEPKYELDGSYYPNHNQMKFVRRP